LNKVLAALMLVTLSCAARAETYSAPVGNETRFAVRRQPLQLTIIKLPSLEVASEVEVGDSMISTVGASPAIRLTKSFYFDFGGEGYKWEMNRDVAFPLIAETVDGRFYEDRTGAVYLLGDREKTEKPALFISKDSSKSNQSCFISDFIGIRCWPLQAFKEGIDFQPSVFFVRESFKRELVYLGVSQNAISILYREFGNDIARPAFSQELKYDISQDKLIGFKGARFTVIKASNTGLIYTVQKHLN